MTTLTYAKICAILAVFFAGMNLHQLTSSYAYLSGKIEEFRLAMKDEPGVARLGTLSMIFYFAMPSAFLLLLRQAEIPVYALAVLAGRFLMTAWVGLWTEKAILSEGPGYTPAKHSVGKVDNGLNILASVWIIWMLVFIRPEG